MVHEDGTVALLPDNDLVLGEGTAVVVVAEDDDAYEALKKPSQVGHSGPAKKKHSGRKK